MSEQFFDARPATCGRHIVDAPVQVEIIFSTHALIEPCKFQQGPAAGANLLRMCANIKTEYSGLTTGWFQQAQQQMDGRGFACPIWSQKAKDDACRNIQ